jgi:hypothetical protein
MSNFTGKPRERCKCWAMVLQRSTGAMFRSYDNCSRRARPGKLTCKGHDYLEAEAQRQTTPASEDK